MDFDNLGQPFLSRNRQEILRFLDLQIIRFFYPNLYKN